MTGLTHWSSGPALGRRGLPALASARPRTAWPGLKPLPRPPSLRGAGGRGPGAGPGRLGLGLAAWPPGAGPGRLGLGLAAWRLRAGPGARLPRAGFCLLPSGVMTCPLPSDVPDLVSKILLALFRISPLLEVSTLHLPN